MNRSWNVTKLIASASFGVLFLVLALLGAALGGVTGIPGTSGFINVFVGAVMFVLCLLVVDRFGAGIIMGLVYGVLAIPLALLGSPGFLPKVVIGIVEGLLADTAYSLLKRNRRVASMAVGSVTQIFTPMAIVVAGRWFGMPGLEQFERIVFSPLAIVGIVVVGAAFGLVGWLIYSRIQDTAVVVRIQGG